MKRAAFFLSFILMVGLLIPPAHAAANVYQETDVIYTEFGVFEVETTTEIYESLSRSNSISGNKRALIRRDGSVIAEVTLFATFGYDGKTAWVTSASSSHVTYDGWTYGSEKIVKSGGTATLDAELNHLSFGVYPVHLSLTCSPTGQLS